MSNGNPTPPSPRRNPGEDPRDPRPARPRNFTGYVLIALIVVIIGMVLSKTFEQPDNMTFPDFMNNLLQGKVKEVKVEKNTVEVEFKPRKDAAPNARTKRKVIVPEKLLLDQAILLEELAGLGNRISPRNDDFALHLARVVHEKQPAGFVVFRRFILADQPREDNKAERRDLILVEVAQPQTNDESLRVDQKERSSVYLLHPMTVVDEKSKKSYDLTFADLLLATTTNDDNRSHGIQDVASVTEILPVAKGTIGFAEGEGLLETLLVSLAPWVLMIVFFYFVFFRQMRSNGIGGNVLSFGRSKARIANREKSTVTFADVAGIEEAKEEVGEIVEFLKHPGRFTRLGGRIPRGVLLVGPPGNGKTLLAKAIAGEADVPFFSICGSDFVEMFVGVGASRVRDLFKQARENAPCIIFLDEIDAVGRRRGAGLGGGHDEREQTLNAILVEMDGFETDTGVIVIAATNRADVLDPALLRPGRFDREIHVDLPDLKGREAILRVHSRKIKLFPGVDLSRIARGTPGFSGAELEAVVNEAAILAVMAKKDFVYDEDLEEARDRVRWGRSKQSRVMDASDIKVTAYHEAGHTLMACITPKANPPHKVTIIPRGRALGVTLMLPEKDQYNFTTAQAEAMLRVAFGGRVAEELVFNEITSGASNDIKQATELARTMVVEWGMSPKLGPINFSDNDEPVFLGRDLGRQTRYGEATIDTIDKEIKRLVEGAYTATRQTIIENRDKLEVIAQNLIQYEVLTREEIEGLVAGESVETVRARRQENIRAIETQRANAATPVQAKPIEPAAGAGQPLAPEGA